MVCGTQAIKAQIAEPGEGELSDGEEGRLQRFAILNRLQDLLRQVHQCLHSVIKSVEGFRWMMAVPA